MIHRGTAVRQRPHARAVRHCSKLKISEVLRGIPLVPTSPRPGGTGLVGPGLSFGNGRRIGLMGDGGHEEAQSCGESSGRVAHGDT